MAPLREHRRDAYDMHRTSMSPPHTSRRCARLMQESGNSPLRLNSHHTALTKHGIIDPTQLPPANTHLVDSKWVFKVKRNADSTIKKFKARLVARGFTQREGIDFNETYAPVVKFNTLRVLLALAAKLDLHVHQMDVITAFLNGDLDVEIWMRLPEGTGAQTVKLRRSLYGLKQSPRLWNKVLDSFLRDLGFTISEVDTALYIRKTDTKILIVAVYVDDLTILASDLQDLADLKMTFAKRFKMEDMGELSYLLGLQVTRNRSKRTISIGQQKYIADMIDKFNLNGMRPNHIPMDPNLHLNATRWSRRSRRIRNQGISVNHRNTNVSDVRDAPRSRLFRFPLISVPRGANGRAYNGRQEGLRVCKHNS